MNKILLIDGNSLTYRAYFGSAYGPRGILTNSQGTPVNAVLTLARMLDKIINKYEPTHILVAFDAGKKTNRHDKMPDYKAGRAKTPIELITQMPLVKQMVVKMGMSYFELVGIEADDIVGSAALKYQNDNNILLLSSDKDLLQLISSNVSMIIPQNGNKDDVLVTNENFVEKYGYRPDQVIDMKAIVGDSSDNLKGVIGIGEKGALKLINEYDNLENIYINIEKIIGKQQEKLQNSKETAFLCKEIATIQKDVVLPFSLDSLKYSKIVTNEQLDFFRDLEINSLVKYYTDIQNKQEKKVNDLFNNLVL